ncbi:MAG: hypothetical protein GW938_10430 [Leptospira sp.]|nr:hypothetical protein [Leptospira sp.]NCS95158.1 hypothetical protein [Leptospira sp.]
MNYKIITIACLFSLTSLFGCKKKENNDDQASALALLLATGTSATCSYTSSGVTLNFVNNTPTATQARIGFTDISGVNKYAAVQAKSLNVGQKVAFKNTGSIILQVYKTTECQIVTGTTPEAVLLTDYSLATSGSNQTYTILSAGSYVFILQTSLTADTNSFTVGLETL